MSFMNESRNPMFGKDALTKQSTTESGGAIMHERTTINGAINKTFVLFGIMMVTTILSFMMPSMFLMYTGLGGGLIAYFVAIFKPHTSPIAAPVYAGFEGLFVGAISAIYTAAYGDAIVLQAVSLTMATLFMMLMIYKTGWIKVTSKFKTGVMMATGAIMLVYVVSFVGSFVGFNVPYIHEGGPIGIGISVVIIGVAALNLLIDFDMFEKAEEHGAPKYMEWFCGMALLVTLVWLYIEMLRLLSKLQRD